MAEHNNIRLLAAVMFADIVGYTRFMQEDEGKAKSLRDHQRKVLENYILEHNGRIMQYYGDGTLSMFGSAIEAVNAAKKIQQVLGQEEPKVPLRIGIHLGDVVYDDEGIYGDAVNIAARIQGLGIPGSVLMSEKIFDEIKNHPGLRVEAFGKHELKNVFQPIGIFALAHKGLEVPSQSYIENLTGTFENSVAVLPFMNMSSDPENEYFSDGITEEIINALVKHKGMSVASRTSVFAYKDQSKDIRKIGEELNVATVLEGSVRKFGNRVRVTAQLINTSDGFHKWSENFDRELKDIFEVQDEIARKISDELKNSFNLSSSKKVYEASTDNVVAYNHYLKGRFYWNKRTPDAVFKAIEYYELAISECDTYTKAYSALANCYSFLAAIGFVTGNEALKKAEAYATKALELDNNSSESYAALGIVNLLFKWDFPEAEACFRKAITLDPDNIDARMGLGYHAMIVGNNEKMVRYFKEAVSLDPLSLPAKQELAKAYNIMGNDKKALAIYNEIFDLDKLYIPAYAGLTAVYINMKDYERAEETIRKAITISGKDMDSIPLLGYIEALKGNKEKAYRILERMKQVEQENHNLNLVIGQALIYAALGDKERTLQSIEQAVDERFGAVLFLHTIPTFDPLKNDPDYVRIFQRLCPEHRIASEMVQ
ncbi:MAG TPA: guanylate cyclase [Balneolaceae bacterium]|nr:guanylate cyclase [Balneolaceae bacterium]|tara:strand:+ start:113069 stop:115036 length:1968 start_codon:yes stop_codon:yes gene_type:complete